MTVPSLLILGTDVVLAATPATPVQLAHACLAAGYDAVIPATWGDELIAARTLERLRAADAPFVQCSCPLVAQRMAANGAAIAPMLLSFVPPPVATAEYLRAVHAPTRVHLTFVGGCPAARHQSIDVWLSVGEFMASLAERGIEVSAQPAEFDSVLPPDRRRYFSDPGGVPTRSILRHLPSAIELHELGPDDLVTNLAQRLLSGVRGLIDVAPALGCSCSGAIVGVPSDVARDRILALEPPRAFASVVDHSVPLMLESGSPLAAPAVVSRRESVPMPPPAAVPAPGFPPAAPSRPSPAPAAAIAPVSHEAALATSAVAVESPARRSVPLSRPVLGTMPHARTEAGRQLPRAYVARRRSTPRGLRASSARGAVTNPDDTQRRRTRWLLVVATGLGAGLVLAWVLRLVV